jgi:23S rRNA U2552 (ribose-2'-O)-methylase RlmE/FtsJ
MIITPRKRKLKASNLVPLSNSSISIMNTRFSLPVIPWWIWGMRLVVGVRCVFYFSLGVAVGLSESCLLLPGELSATDTPERVHKIQFKLTPTHQVAVNLVKPNGRVVGLDILSANPPKGVSTLQGNFLSPSVQQMLINFLRDPNRGRPKTAEKITEVPSYVDMERYTEATPATPAATPVAVTKGTTEATEATNPEAVAAEGVEAAPNTPKVEPTPEEKAAQTAKEKEEKNLAKAEERKNKCVDVVLSDMSEPWFPDAGSSQKSLTNPYIRLMNTSGIAFKDHVGSMVRSMGVAGLPALTSRPCSLEQHNPFHHLSSPLSYPLFYALSTPIATATVPCEALN